MTDAPTTFFRGEDPLRAVKLNQAFGERVFRGGDTMLGMLTLFADPVVPYHAVTKQYVDTAIAAVIAGSGSVPEAPIDGVTYGRLNTTWNPVLPLTGGTIDGFLQVNGPVTLDADTNNIELFANNIFFDEDHHVKFWKNGTQWQLYDNDATTGLALVYDAPAGLGISIYTGDTSGDDSSPLNFYTGSASSGSTGSITLQPGVATGVGETQGNVRVQLQDNALRGRFIVTGGDAYIGDPTADHILHAYGGGADWPGIFINRSAAVTGTYLGFGVGGNYRWDFEVQGTESGADSGAEFTLNRVTDDQHWHPVFTITRVDGAILLGGMLTLQADPTANLHAATKQYVDGLRRNKSRLQAQWQNAAVVSDDTVWWIDMPYPGTIDTLKYFTGNGSFTVAIKINGVTVTGLSAVVVSSSSTNTATATALRTFAAGDTVSAVITGSTGDPTDALISAAVTWS